MSYIISESLLVEAEENWGFFSFLVYLKICVLMQKKIVGKFVKYVVTKIFLVLNLFKVCI